MENATGARPGLLDRPGRRPAPIIWSARAIGGSVIRVYPLISGCLMRFAEQFLSALPALLACTVAATSVRAADPPPRRPAPVPVDRVTIDDAFWSPKRKIWRTVTVNDCLDKFERDGAFRNFDHVARGELDAPHGGPQWYDGLVYEVITGAADLMARERDPAQLEECGSMATSTGSAPRRARRPGRLHQHVYADARARPSLGPERRQRPRAT